MITNKSSSEKLAGVIAHKNSKLGIRSKIILGFSCITIIFLVSMVTTLTIVKTTKNFTHDVLTISLPSYDAFSDLNTAVNKSLIDLQEWVSTGTLENKNNFTQEWDKISQVVASINRLQVKWNNENYSRLWLATNTALSQLKEAEYKIYENTNKSNKTQLEASIISDVFPLINRFSELTNVINDYDSAGQNKKGIIDMQSDELSKGIHNIMDKLNFLQILEYFVLGAAIFLSVIITIFTSRAIVHHLNIFREHSSRIASGDLTQYVSVETNDEIGQLGNDLNKMTDGLSSITRQITESCKGMVSSLEEVRHAVDTQSSGSSQQASSINEITVSLSEIEKSSTQTMEKAKTLGEVAERTREKGQMGLEAVEQSVQGMKAVREKVQTIAQTILDLSNQTQQVGEITAVVNNLAQQSKMLALNASIEAAKAGEAGKGFSVVAVEVKNLAEQSEQSTTQVQKILEDIRHAAEKAVMVTEEGTKGVDQGTILVEQTGEIIKNLNEVIHETTIATQQIEAAVRQEGAGIEQITAGMNEINQVTSSFVESSKQTKEAMSNLSELTKNLKTYVDVYKV